MENLTIRQAVDSDMELINESIKGYDLNARDVSPSECFIAETTENEMAGFVRIKEVSGIHELNAIAVVEGFQNKGIGRKLLDHAVKTFSDHKIYILTTMEDFFANFGFKRAEGHEDILEKLKNASENSEPTAVFMTLP